MKLCPKCGHQNAPERIFCEECGADIAQIASDGKDPLLGAILVGKFHIQEMIGQGAMGRVYRAIQKPINREVAIKILHQHLVEDQRVARRFQREAEAASRFNHPNSIAIFDFGQTETGSLYIAMEYITGRDLAAIIAQDAPLDTDRVIRIGSQVLSALQLAHANKIIHRDLKPENVMLAELPGQEEVVKVCDFGIAKIQQSAGLGSESALTMFGMICGTPYYMSPEQAKGEELDGRTDLYSMGVILYEMLTGEVPFRGSTPVEVIARHLTDTPERPSKLRPENPVPRILEEVVMRALSKKREERFANAEAFRLALEHARQETAFHLDLERVLQHNERSPERPPTGVSIPVTTAANDAATVIRHASAIAGSPSLAPSSSSTSVPQIAIGTARPLRTTPHPMPATPPPHALQDHASPPISNPAIGVSHSITSIQARSSQIPVATATRTAPSPITPPPPTASVLPHPNPSLSVPTIHPTNPTPLGFSPPLSSPPRHDIFPTQNPISTPAFDDFSEPVRQKGRAGRWVFLLLLLLLGIVGGYFIYIHSQQGNPLEDPTPQPRNLSKLPEIPPSNQQPKTTPKTTQDTNDPDGTDDPPTPARRPATRRPKPRKYHNKTKRKRTASNQQQDIDPSEINDIKQQFENLQEWKKNHLFDPADFGKGKTYYKRAINAHKKGDYPRLQAALNALEKEGVSGAGIPIRILQKKYERINQAYDNKKAKLSSTTQKEIQDLFHKLISGRLIITKPPEANKKLNRIHTLLKQGK